MNESRFLRVAAVCSVVSAVTTLLLIFLPEFFVDAQGFEARIARVHETAYSCVPGSTCCIPSWCSPRRWGSCTRSAAQRRCCALAECSGFFGGHSPKPSQQTLTLFAFDRWRVAYAAADEATRAAIRVNT